MCGVLEMVILFMPCSNFPDYIRKTWGLPVTFTCLPVTLSLIRSSVSVGTGHSGVKPVVIWPEGGTLRTRGEACGWVSV